MQTVDTKPFLLGRVGPGNEARATHYTTANEKDDEATAMQLHTSLPDLGYNISLRTVVVPPSGGLSRAATTAN